MMNQDKPPLAPVLLRRNSSKIDAHGMGSIPGGNPNNSSNNSGNNNNSLSNSSHGVPIGIVDPNITVPVVADDDPGNPLSQSTHKRKQSGCVDDDIIRTLEAMEQQDEEYRRERMEADAMGDVEQQSLNFNQRYASSILSSSSSLLTSRNMSLVVAAVLLATFAMSRSTTINPTNGTNNPNAMNNPLGGTTVNRPPIDATKGVQYGEEHMEVVGEPKQAQIHEYNKVRYYDKPDKMKPMISKGPIPYSFTDDEDGNDDDLVASSSPAGGLHVFEDVCITNNIDALRYRPMDTTLRGLLYFTNDDAMLSNDKRCVPCSNTQHMQDWESINDDEQIVGHKCGLHGLHAMYASSVGDWSECITTEENTKLMKEWGQTQSPLEVETVHFFVEPTFLLQFNALDMEASLFDMLMTYLPHWAKFRNHDDYPFDSVISHSLEGCLSHNHNWFCEILHQVNAFGPAKEIPWEADHNTLYCFKALFYNQGGYQRNLDHEGMVTKDVFGEFREILFRKFALQRRRNHHAYQKEAAAEGVKASESENTKIIFYDNKLSAKTVWNEMESLITKARELEKYQDIKFVTVDDFSDLTVAEQAKSFNEADAVIMVHGEQMANAIFSVDRTTFVEVGCKVSSLIGNPRFMELMDGNYKSVEKCTGKKGKDDNVCVACEGEGGDDNFTMTPDAFEKMIDDVVKSLRN